MENRFIVLIRDGTENLSLPRRRVRQHREGLIPGFTKAYGVHVLVWYEVHATMEAAIVREKRLKEWRRAWKIELIEAQNEDWGDLGVGLGLAPLPPVPTKESMT